MPKIVPYTKGSIVFFEGDKDERIFILQSGTVILSQNDLETGNKISEALSVGEFFGVKNALAHKPRMETATCTTEVTVVQVTVQEFEKIFSPNQEVVLKMLKVFSKNLREIHRKTESVLKNEALSFPPEVGMMIVAKCFYDEQKYHSCADVCKKILAKFPSTSSAASVKNLLEESTLQAERQAKHSEEDWRESVTSKDDDSSLKQFELPMFERFSKTYHDGDVIICEFEPGDCFYLIQSGQVQLEKCVKETIKNLDILRPGEFFGEMAILDNSPRSATCLAKGEVKCLEFNKANFRILVTGNPQIAMVLLKLFCKRIYDQRRRFGILIISELPARVADVFLMYDEMTPNSASESSQRRRFALTVSDVAHWAGISTDEAREELNKLVSKNKLEIFDNYMIIGNIMDMKRTVDTYFAAHGVENRRNRKL